MSLTLLPTMAPWPHFESDEIEAVARVLQSGKVNYWTGQEGQQFQQEYADYLGVRHAIALANGTVTLELALKASGIGPGHEVIVPARTFIGTASAVAVRGAQPVCADVDRLSGNLTAATVAPLITAKTRAIVCVHLAGWPCEMEALKDLATAHNLVLMEDCAQAHGAFYRDRPVGSLGDWGSFSFCQDKILTTGGEGGMLVTNHTDWWKEAWAYKDHGKNYDTVFHEEHPPGFRWLHESFGTNWRMTEMQSALGRVLLRKLDDQVKIRRRHVETYYQAVEALSVVRCPRPQPELYHSYYKFYAYVEPEALKTDWSRDRILAEVADAGLPIFSGSCSEIYLEKAFPQAWRPEKRLPMARELGETSLMLQAHPTLSDQFVAQAAELLAQVLRQAQR